MHLICASSILFIGTASRPVENKLCVGPIPNRSQLCQIPCPIDCEVSPWGAWGPCTFENCDDQAGKKGMKIRFDGLMVLSVLESFIYLMCSCKGKCMTHKLMLQFSAFIIQANLQFPSLDEPLKKHETWNSTANPQETIQREVQQWMHIHKNRQNTTRQTVKQNNRTKSIWSFM